MSREMEYDVNRAIRTQDEVARIMRLSRTTVSRIEREAINKIAREVVRMAGGGSTGPRGRFR